MANRFDALSVAVELDERLNVLQAGLLHNDKYLGHMTLSVINNLRAQAIKPAQ